MRKREFGVSFGSGGVAVACRLPWVGVADGDFPRGFPGGFCPLFFSFFIVLIVVGAWSLPSLFLVRVFRGESAPWPGRDVSLRITFFQVMGPVA